MKAGLLLLFILTSMCSVAQRSIDTTSIFIYDSVTNTTTDFSRYFGISAVDNGHTEWFNKHEEDGGAASQLSYFIIDTITESDFLKYKGKYKSKLNKDSSLVEWTDSSFIITTEHSKKTFNTLITDDHPYNYYLGFLKQLNLFVTWYIDGHNEIGSMMLLDNVSGKSFELSLPFDNPNETVLLSPKENNLITYANTSYETDHCFISVIQINKSKKHFKPVFKSGLYIDKVNIEDLVFINENSFAIAVTEAIDGAGENETKKRCYLKASIKEQQ